MSKYNITIEIEVSNIDSADIKDYVKDIRGCVWDAAASAIIKDVTYKRILEEDDKEIYNMAIADMKRSLNNYFIHEYSVDDYVIEALRRAADEAERKCIKI